MTREEMIKELIEKMTSEVSFFNGKYDANHVSEHFMNGIGAVMEYLSYCVSEEYGDNFSQKFLKNMLDSEKKI